MYQRIAKFWTLTLLLAAGLSVFQNCGSPRHNLASMSAKAADFFLYPFSTKPEFYSDVLLLKPANSIVNLTEFKVMASAVYIANPAAPITYEIRIRDDRGRTMCPVQTGTLPAGDTSLDYNCVSSVVADEARVEFKMRAGTVNQTFNKVFRN